ncbi:TPA_asm: nucleocapsid protein [Holcus virus 1]|uniref:Nucleoprotein n=1 Tax=Holcus virus 1 TaxID=2984270 RepID=A0A9N6YJL3_9RHAB|nr:TPA_asm: nucleocapsid protein [Holcus virus 1]
MTYDLESLKSRMTEASRNLKRLRASALNSEDAETHSQGDCAPCGSVHSGNQGFRVKGRATIGTSVFRKHSSQGLDGIEDIFASVQRQSGVVVRMPPVHPGEKLKRRKELIYTLGPSQKTKSNTGSIIQDWSDTRLLRLTTFEIRRLDEHEVLSACDIMLSGLTDAMTEIAAKATMQLAYNLRYMRPDRWVFPRNNSCQPTIVTDGHFSTRVMFKGNGPRYVRHSGLSNVDYIVGCCYVAASTLRLFTKTAESYVKSFPQIAESYYKFYHDAFPLEGLAPDKKCIEGLKIIYINKPVFRNALAPFLYSFPDLGESKGMCTQLFEQHLALTGMHAVNLYVKLCQYLNCGAEELGAGLWHRTTRDALLEIKRIIVHHRLSKEEDQMRQTWMYARLYSDRYFVSVQTKYCRNLVCAMARMASQMGISGNHDIMNIVHIQRMTGYAKENPVEWGDILLYLIERSEKASEGNSITSSRRILD